MRPKIEDSPPFVPSWGFCAKRFFLASEIPLALMLMSVIFIVGACALSVLFMVTP